MDEPTDRLFYRRIVLFARHGVHEEEARLGQRFEIDLDCRFDTRGFAPGDDFAAAVDYGAVYETVRQVTEGQRFNLIEALGDRVARSLLERFPLLAEVRVEVRKPAAPVPGVFDMVGVEIVRRRADLVPS